MIPKDGQYYYARLRSAYAIYQNHDSGNGHSYSDKIADNLSKIEAIKKTNELNNKRLKL